MKSDLVIKAANVIRDGGVIAYPTEAVWGLGCDPWCESAVHALLRIKQRSMEKGLIIVTGDISQLSPLISTLSPDLAAKISHQEKRAITWLIPDKTGWIPDCVKGNHDTVAVRVSEHPAIKALCQATGFPVVSTSANLAGETAITEYSEIISRFDKKVDMILPGATGKARKASRIIDLATGGIIRS